MKASTVIIGLVLSAILIAVTLWVIGLATPLLAQNIGDRVERWLDQEEGGIAERLNSKRERVNERFDVKANKRRTDWENKRNSIEGCRERKVDRIDDR
jgi:siroheme synthase (precorrin-2 oxidase/ferrochelatase)